MHVVIIVGDYGEHRRHVPVVKREPDAVIIGIDYRTPVVDRVQAVVNAAPDVTSLEGVVAHTQPYDCTIDAHDWRRVVERGLIVGSRCALCGTTEQHPATLPNFTSIIRAAS